jgi:hypothetical protein
VGSTLALAHLLYYKRLVQLASTIFGTIKFWRRCQEIIDATAANTEAVAWLEGQFCHLVAELNRIEE